MERTLDGVSYNGPAGERHAAVRTPIFQGMDGIGGVADQDDWLIEKRDRQGLATFDVMAFGGYVPESLEHFLTGGGKYSEVWTVRTAKSIQSAIILY